MRRLLLLLAFVFVSTEAVAQIQVHLRITRKLYIAYEPIIATIQISNFTGREITLRDTDSEKWFGFQIRTGDDRLVPPRDAEYGVAPMAIAAGQSIKRSVNLVSLYPVTDYGLYRARVAIYFADLNRYFTSQQVNFEVSEGKLVWHQTVGVPEGEEGAGTYRTFSVLTFRQPRDNMLYVRTEDRENGIIFSTYPIARVLIDNQPQYLLDNRNNLHLLQLIGPKSYAYTRISVNGKFLGQTYYNELKTRPKLRRDAKGNIAVAGGREEIPIAQSSGAPAPPKLSDRPPDLPKE